MSLRDLQGLFQTSDCPPPLVVAVGDSKGVGSRPVTDDLAVNLGPASPGVLELFENEHPGPFTQNEAIAIAIEGPAGSLGLVVACREGRQADEAGHAEGMDHAVRAAGKDDVGAAATNELESLADGLRAGSAGGQAIRVEPPGPVYARQVARWRSRLLLGLAHRVEFFRAQPGKLRRIDMAVTASSGSPGSRTEGNPAGPRQIPGTRRIAVGRARACSP